MRPSQDIINIFVEYVEMAEAMHQRHKNNYEEMRANYECLTLEKLIAQEEGKTEVLRDILSIVKCWKSKEE